MLRIAGSSVLLLPVLGSLLGAVQKDAAHGSAARDESLRRALVWIEPRIPVERASLDANPSDDFQVSDEVECDFDPKPLGGNTPKFDCELENGETIRVKYGRDNQEIYAEVAASRLLSALGFPTDDIYVIKRIRCFGCPPDPFKSLAGRVDDDVSLDFDDVIIERPRRGRHIETSKIKGWRWRELSKIDPAVGGASRAHVDALRLMAVFLSHWDNKPENQRLMCVDQKCSRPLAMVHDLGGTFGPFKVDLEGWANRPIWADPATCLVSMRGLPYEGSSFDDVRISEEGRAFLADRLGRLSDDQIHRLFAGARFDRAPRKDPDGGHIAGWVRAFETKRDAIVKRPSCPT